MAITGADKIFVDVDDEINFVVEKILAAEKERVILVVPQNAIIISSLVSMKILAKQIAKSKKNLIVVTEDGFGLGLAERSGIIAINKVSNIAPEMWEAAQIAKEDMRSKTDEIKKKLLTERGIIKPEPEVKPAAEPEAETENEPEATEVVADQEIPEDELEEVEQEASDSAETAEVLESEPADAEIPSEQVDTEPEPEAEVKGAINRPRREPKVVHLAGFEILAGGDIARLSPDKDVMIGDSDVLLETESDSEDMDIEEDDRSKPTGKSKPTNGFTGRDWTNYTKDKKGGISLSGINPFKRTPVIVPGERKPIFPTDEVAKPAVSKKKIIIAIVVVLLFLFLGGGYVLAFQLNTVDIKVSLQTQQIPVQQAISADVAVTAIDKEKLVIPAKVVVDDQLSISASDKASGEGKKGDKAAGSLDLWNYTCDKVTLPAGTIVESTTTNLKYVTRAEVSIEGSTHCHDSIKSPTIVNDGLGVQASTFGEEYNITDSDSDKHFKIASYATTEVEGIRVRKIDGGTSTTFVAVSQEDVDKVKKTLSETLQKQGNTKISSVVPAGYRLIDGTQKFEETESSSDPKVGEKADNFSVSLKGKVTALAVSEADLQSAISILITNNQKVGSDFVINGLSDAIIGDVKRDGDKVTFTVSSSGNLQSKVTADDLKTNLAGKSLEEAETYLNSISEIVGHKITFSPAIVPESLRRIPSDMSRIKITF